MTEDFTTYIEVDNGNDLTVIAAKITAANMPRNVDNYVYKDFGANHFTDTLTHYVDVATTDETSNWGKAYVWGITDTVDDGSGWANGLYVYVPFRTGTPNYYQVIVGEVGGNVSGAFNLAINTQYYFTITRNGAGTFKCEVFSDADRTVSVGSNSIVETQTSFRYIYGIASYNDGSAVQWGGEISNLELNEATAISSNSKHLYDINNLITDKTSHIYDLNELVPAFSKYQYEIMNRFAFSATVYPTTNLYFEANQASLPSTVQAYSQTTQDAIVKISWTWQRPTDEADVFLYWDDAQAGQVWYAADNGNFTNQVSWNDVDFNSAKVVLSSTANSNPDYIWLKTLIPDTGGTKSFTVYLDSY